MAKESFDKEVQFLRMLVLTSGAYSRQQFAQRLGISVHTFDKTLRRLKDIVGTVCQQLPEAQGREFADMLRFNYYESVDPMLLFLYRAKSVKESESYRLSLMIAALQQRSHTAMELLDVCGGGMPGDIPMPDEKTIRSDLRYLEDVGVIRRDGGGRPYRYAIHNRLVDDLTEEERIDLYAFVDVMANTQVPSVQGYLLRDSLKKALKLQDAAEPFLYRYHYYSRILDEAHLFTLLQAIRERRTISFLYFPPKKRQSYGSKNTNPLFERESEGKQAKMLPLKVVYDHQYGRWYLLGYARQDIVKYRVEGITQIIEDGDATDEPLFAERMELLELRTRFSWLIDTGRAVLVRARFFNPEGVKANFVRERVELQGQWGEITETTDESFIYEITVNGTTEIKPWLRSFGSSCEVLEPIQLRREFIAEWKELQAYYEPVRENL
ncbi:helix-turn-helix transcriptional regulator [Paenibacillus spongiae]|uniref:WYL domain-containing protein n=1 Tax=Paenibacillus spongiae TaxID=2909671 RepID=A0ABY5SAY4_9BACL|nr:WYL domain-containing protein [Paenibacillus spongiae]UVI31091.1 WYL domain-containing protein [Paenibacillus spongiae]